jgi:hypothetical protein
LHVFQKQLSLDKNIFILFKYLEKLDKMKPMKCFSDQPPSSGGGRINSRKLPAANNDPRFRAVYAYDAPYDPRIGLYTVPKAVFEDMGFPAHFHRILGDPMVPMDAKRFFESKEFQSNDYINFPETFENTSHYVRARRIPRIDTPGA